MSAKKDENSELTPRQERFCEEYLKDLNAGKAAARAGYSKKSASSAAKELFQRPHVIAKIEKLKLERSKRTQIDVDWVLKRLALIADSDLNDAFDDKGQLKKIRDIPKDLRLAVAAVSLSDNQYGRSEKIKLWDKVKTLELIGKHIKMFTEKIEHSGQIEQMSDSEIDKRLKELLDKK